MLRDRARDRRHRASGRSRSSPSTRSRASTRRRSSRSAVSVVVALYRAVRREPLTNAIGGILGTGLAVFIALRTGSASGYFVPRALQNAGARARVPDARSSFRRPLVGLIAAPLYHIPERLAPGPAGPAPVRRGVARRGPSLFARARDRLHGADRGRQGGRARRRRRSCSAGRRSSARCGSCYRYVPRRLQAARRRSRGRRAPLSARADTFACRYAYVRSPRSRAERVVS